MAICNINQYVVYLGYEVNGLFRPGGTGFLMSVITETSHKGYAFTYLITAKHVVTSIRNDCRDAQVRFNTRRGPDRKVGYGIITLQDEWCYPDNEASDLAVIRFPWATAEAMSIGEQAHIWTNDMLTDAVVSQLGVGIGDELLISGLFTQRHGNEQNIPIVRSGIISAMPDEPLIDENNGLPYNGYLAEIRSIGGLSGSPVFVKKWTSRNRDESNAYGHQDTTTQMYLLGVIRGHWDYRTRADSMDSALNERDTVNMGIAIVTPVDELTSLLHSDDLKQRRREEDRHIAKEEASGIHKGYPRYI